MREIILEGTIGSEGTTAGDIIPRLARAGDVTIRIDSPGGNAFDALAIHQALRQHKGRVTARIVGMAASGASIIAMAADDIVVTPTARLMIHNPVVAASGDGGRLRMAAELADNVQEVMASIYANRSRQGIGKIAALMSAETWLSADEAVALGLADRTAALTIAEATEAFWRGRAS